ncbi:carbohydrate sulfotransferase 14-like [Saccostrea cucullata]|uniref:carbohydrate sulfotransferase 14-like n=1 Tax=Saccostrea cuccullata TaxID=36930 RepID=UPI002ED3E416
MRIKAYKVCCCVSIFCGSCLILFAFRSTIFVGKVWNSFNILNQKYHVDKSKYVQMSPTQLREQRMQKRVQHLRSTCKLADINRYNFDFRQVSENFYGNKEANLSYCKVPKAGSSFMTEIFLVLEKDRVQSVDEIFEISRSHVHVIGNRKLSTSALIKTKQSNSVTLIVSRNPYSRLYSAYVDKFYLFGLVKEAREISKKSGKRSLSCGYNVTFTEFLDYVISKAYGGYQINRHWAPVYLLCHACDVRYDIVSKTDSLSADIEYVLDNINISYETRNKLIKLIHNKIDNKSVISLLNTYITLKSETMSRFHTISIKNLEYTANSRKIEIKSTISETRVFKIYR